MKSGGGRLLPPAICIIRFFLCLSSLAAASRSQSPLLVSNIDKNVTLIRGEKIFGVEKGKAFANGLCSTLRGLYTTLHRSTSRMEFLTLSSMAIIISTYLLTGAHPLIL
jgi:hypothetical protein